MPAKRPKPGVPPKHQALLYGIIILSAGMIIWEKAKDFDDERLWWMLLWLAVMLAAFYKATQNWAYVNPKPDPLEDDDEPAASMYEIQDIEVPSLEEMTENLTRNKPENPSDE